MKQTSLSVDRILFRVIQMGLYGLLVTPLLFWDKLLFFHVSTKTYFIFTVSQILFIAFLWSLIRIQESRFTLSIIEKMFFLYIVILAVTSFIGLDPARSFWGSLDRMSGLLLWIHILFVFILAISHLRIKQQWISFFSFSVWIALIVTGIHLLSLGGTQIVPLANSGSTFGNSTFFGTYLLFHFFFAVWLSVEQSKYRWFFVSCALLFITTLLFTIDANAVQLATVGGAILLVALLLMTQGKTRATQWFGRGLLATLFLAFIFVVVLAFQPGSVVREKLINISSESRFVLWNMASQGIEERPIFGWGLETFGYVSLKHHNPCFGTTACGAELWFDRAHNKLLDVWIESGIIGLGFYVALFISTIITVWRYQKKDKQATMTTALVTSCLAAYFVQNLTGVDMTVSLLFWIFLLAFASRASRSEFYLPQQIVITPAQRFSKWIPFGATLLLPISLYFFVYQPLKGNLLFAQVTNAETLEARLIPYEKAVSTSPLAIDMRRIFLALHTATVFWQIPEDILQKNKTTIATELTLAEKGLLENKSVVDELRTALMLGIIYQTKGHFFNPAEFQKAETILLNAIHEYPLHPQSKWILAGVYLDQRKISEALEMTQSVLEQTPSAIAYQYHLTAIRLTLEQEVFEAEANKALEQFSTLEKTIEELKLLNPEKDKQALLARFHQ